MFELCVITDRALSNGLSEAETAKLAYSGGADIVQLRMKGFGGKEITEQARLIKGISDEYGKFFIVNDRVDVALLSDADGVHLGQSDISVEDARALIGDDKLIGVTVHDAEEAMKAESDGADYVSIGSVFNTSTKQDAIQGLGLDAVFTVRQAVDIPVMAIGGINRGNIQDVIRAGADGVAVVSAVVSQKDIRSAAHELRDMILKVRPNI
ncbi:MAG: thiamine phosphate synthase [Candidatus Methanoplasma sp.]|jgi:thiamine-phosphate pyrophosphorylase|nr:thiamine phosphate synthase [Candidatus Methanoplasma sp.]